MKTISTQQVYKGKIINVFRDEVVLDSGTKTIREAVRHSEAVAVVAVDDKRNILMVKQYRYAIGKELLEIPAGLIDEGEQPLDAAKRELLEETGCTALIWRKLIEFFPSPGCHDERIHIFTASQIQETFSQKLDEDEELTVSKIPVEQLLQLIKEGSIEDGKTIVGLILAECCSQLP